MRSIFILAVMTVLVTGCAGSPGNPTAPSANNGAETNATVTNGRNASERYDPHMLWGEWDLLFSADHTEVDVIPKRTGRFHLNATKFLESYCSDCLEIINIKNNGDDTIDLTVQITHPFPDNPEYTGFDVKGIIMFDGSHELEFSSVHLYPYGSLGNPAYFRVSWAQTGDPEVLNQDGYSVLWTPWWDSGSSLPIFNYWPGKYSNGSPTANINAYRNFYTDEERHMFRVDGQENRIYTIYLPPGPVAAGYAIDACWAPPDVTPVTDPANDFPITANQEEPYYFRYIWNNDEPIVVEPCCGWVMDCSDLRIEYAKWYGDQPTHTHLTFHPDPDPIETGDAGLDFCDCAALPPVKCLLSGGHTLTGFHENDGTYRGVALLFRYFVYDIVAYDVFEYTIDLD